MSGTGGTSYTKSRQSAMQAFSQVVRIGYPRPLIRKRVLPPPPLVLGEGHTHLWVRGRGEPIRTKGQTLWYSIIPLSSYTKLQYFVTVNLDTFLR
jgi:hypothetical protein